MLCIPCSLMKAVCVKDVTLLVLTHPAWARLVFSSVIKCWAYRWRGYSEFLLSLWPSILKNASTSVAKLLVTSYLPQALEFCKAHIPTHSIIKKWVTPDIDWWWFKLGKIFLCFIPVCCELAQSKHGLTLQRIWTESKLFALCLKLGILIIYALYFWKNRGTYATCACIAPKHMSRCGRREINWGTESV